MCKMIEVEVGIMRNVMKCSDCTSKTCHEDEDLVELARMMECPIEDLRAEAIIDSSKLDDPDFDLFDMPEITIH